jgi:hypothetical protein
MHVAWERHLLGLAFGTTHTTAGIITTGNYMYDQPSWVSHATAGAQMQAAGSTAAAVPKTIPKIMQPTCLPMHETWERHFLGLPGRRTYTVTAFATCE